MTSRGELPRGHHRLGIADGGKNVPSNIAYTGEKSIDRSMFPQIVLDYYDSTYATKKNPHPKTLAFYEQNGIVQFGKNPLHTDATTLQQRLHIWQKEQGYRRK